MVERGKQNYHGQTPAHHDTRPYQGFASSSQKPVSPLQEAIVAVCQLATTASTREKLEDRVCHTVLKTFAPYIQRLIACIMGDGGYSRDNPFVHGFIKTAGKEKNRYLRALSARRIDRALLHSQIQMRIIVFFRKWNIRSKGNFY